VICAVMDQFRSSGTPRCKLITLSAGRLSHDHRYVIDFPKIMAELGWQPRYYFEQGLEYRLIWYLNNHPKLRQKILSLQNHPG